MADEHVDALLDPLRHPGLAALGSDGVRLHHRDREAVASEEVVHAPGDVAGTRVGGVDQHPSALPSRSAATRSSKRLLFRVEPLFGERRHLHEHVPGLRVEDGLAPRAAVRVGEERLQVGGQQPLRALRQRLREGGPQRLEDGVVGAPLGEAAGVLLVVHRRKHHPLLVGRQPGGHVREAQEDAGADEVEEGRGGEPRTLPDHLAVLAPAARAPVLERLAVVAPDGVLDEAVALDPAALLPAPELGPDLRREPVEEVEES